MRCECGADRPHGGFNIAAYCFWKHGNGKSQQSAKEGGGAWSAIIIMMVHVGQTGGTAYGCWQQLLAVVCCVGAGSMAVCPASCSLFCYGCRHLAPATFLSVIRRGGAFLFSGFSSSFSFFLHFALDHRKIPRYSAPVRPAASKEAERANVASPPGLCEFQRPLACLDLPSQSTE